MLKQRLAGALERFLALALLASLALAQPLLNLLGIQAEFLVAHGLGKSELLAFALLLGVLLPALMGLVPVLAGKVQARLGSAVFYSLFGILAALVFMPFLVRLGWQGPGAAAAFVLVALVSPWLFHRFAAVRLFFKYFSPAVLIFPLAFLFFSRATALFLDEGSRAGHAAVTLHNTPDIVFLVFDEFPLVSLLDSSLQIDRRRFPNFARLADQATWYRGVSSPAETTVAAVPALLSGLQPDPAGEPLPIAANFPRNLFTLLQGSYRMMASETATRLCPGSRCQSFTATESQVPPAQSLIRDLSLIYLHLVTPPPWSERLASISNAWSGFNREQGAQLSTPSQNPGLEYAQVVAELSQNVAWSTRASEVEQFIAAIEPRPEPALYYLHSLLPHAEWRYTRSGQQYLTEERWEALSGGHGPGIDNDDVWADDSFAVQQNWQRHLWQVQFVDRLLGEVLDRLESMGMLDSTLLVLTGDHGASFLAGQPRRSINKATLTDISAVPLLIKYPEQHEGVIDDSPVSLTDVLPTLIDVLGGSVDWELDGRTLGRDKPGRQTVQVLKKNSAVFEYPVETHRAHLQQRAQDLAATFQADDKSGEFILEPHPGLLGLSPDPLAQSADKSATVLLENDRFYQDVQLDASFVPLQVRGVVEGLPDIGRPRALAVVINGRIAATTRTLDITPFENRFSVLLPEGSLQPGRNTVEVYLIDEQAGTLSLARLSQAGSSVFELSGGEEGETIRSAEFGSLRVQSSEPGVRVYTRQTEAGSLVRISGAVDAPNIEASEVLVFLDGQQAGQGAVRGGQFSVLVPPPKGKTLDRVTARIFLISATAGLAWEAAYPAPCSADWLFAPSDDSPVSECASAGSPLHSVEGRLQADIDLKDPESLAYFTRAWGTETAGIAWSLGKSSSMVIPVPTDISCLSFRALVKPFLHPPVLESQSLWLTTNGIETGSWVLDQNDFSYIEWQLSEAVLKARPGVIVMDFLLPDAVSPESINAGKDQRTLGVALLKLQIRSCQ